MRAEVLRRGSVDAEKTYQTYSGEEFNHANLFYIALRLRKNHLTLSSVIQMHITCQKLKVLSEFFFRLMYIRLF